MLSNWQLCRCDVESVEILRRERYEESNTHISPEGDHACDTHMNGDRLVRFKIKVIKTLGCFWHAINQGVSEMHLHIQDI